MNQDALQHFIDSEIEPNVGHWEQTRHVPTDVFTKAGEAKLCGLMLPTELGGGNLPLQKLLPAFEQLAYSDMGFAFALVVHNNFANAVAREGPQLIRDKYLPGMLAGETIGAFLLTEPSGGTNASRLTTIAEPVGDGWRLNGEKAWVTNANRADLLRVYAQTEPGSGTKGIAAFAVEATQTGVSRLAPYEMLGAHSIGAGGFRFDNVELKAEQLFSPPGTAYKSAMGGIGLARVLVASLCVGILRRALDISVDRLNGRQAFGQRLSDNQGLRWILADIATDIEATAALTNIAAQSIDSQAPDNLVKAAHAKKFAARAATKGIEQCMQMFGAD
ncbi:MAG: acyl-CoA dehydrogenase family protein, partial [Pseudomonadota bacterium]